MSQSVSLNLPVKAGEDFVGELETMDLSELKGKSYLVAVNQGDRNKVKFLPSTIRGPFSFEEMCEQVGVMWKEHQHHAKVLICSQDATKPLVNLDENTVDYIEAHFQDIITEAMLDGIFDDKEYTCRAGLNEDSNEENPLAVENQKKEESSVDEDEDL